MLWKLPHIFFVCSLRKPIGCHRFKKVLLELFSLSFFIKWWNSTKLFFFCMRKQYLWKFSSHKITIEIYLIYWNVLIWILSDYLAFHRNPTKFYIYLFSKKIIYIHIIYQCIATNFSCCFLEESHLLLLLATTWRSNL